MNLPSEFLSRMKNELGDEYDNFVASYNLPVAKAIRVNTLKISVEDFKKISPFAVEPIEWSPFGFYTEADKVGRHPYHFVGLYYSQEASAMSVAGVLGVKSGDKVLDLCSAPGGKGTQLAQYLGENGLLVLNEKVPNRAKILLENVERMGIKNAVVLNEETSSLARKFCGYFDRILVDAPCSGEGMFKKEDEAVSNWSLENVQMCADRQLSILTDASKMVKVGGRIAYSTCTFSKEEDEGLIERFLNENKNFKLCTLPKYNEWSYISNGMAKLYPHKVKGEGHFLCLLEKVECFENETPEIMPIRFKEDKTALKLYNDFSKDFFKDDMNYNLYFSNNVAYALPNDMFDFKGLHLLRAGVKVGEIVKDRFEPSHSLATTLKPNECINVANYNSTEIEKYLKGETMPAYSSNGWCLVTVDNYSIGLGKISGITKDCKEGVLKNHFPKALRLVK